MTATQCQWEPRRAHFTGTAYAECLTCRATCHYFESLDELEADCQQIADNSPRNTNQ